MWSPLGRFWTDMQSCNLHTHPMILAWQPWSLSRGLCHTCPGGAGTHSCHQSNSSRFWCYYLPHTACCHSTGWGMLPPCCNAPLFQRTWCQCNRVCRCRHNQDVAQNRWHSAERRHYCRREHSHRVVHILLQHLLIYCCRLLQGSPCLRACDTCILEMIAYKRLFHCLKATAKHLLNSILSCRRAL